MLERAKALNAASMDMLAAAQTVAEDPSVQASKVALAQVRSSLSLAFESDLTLVACLRR